MTCLKNMIDLLPLLFVTLMCFIVDYCINGKIKYENDD